MRGFTNATTHRVMGRAFCSSLVEVTHLLMLVSEPIDRMPGRACFRLQTDQVTRVASIADLED